MRKSSKKPAAAASNVPAIVPAAKPSAKPGKAGPVAVKPAVPAAAEQRAARQALTDASRAVAAKLYSGGSSLAVHASRSPKLADAIARISKPVQIAANGASIRDESGLHVIASHANGDNTFDPTSASIAADLGVLSRLASLGYIAVKAGAALPHLTPSGIERAKLVAKRA